jgi:hypothetical protein
MALAGNTLGSGVYKEEWEIKLQERLSEDNLWKQVCRVDYTDSKVLHNPYSTDMTVQSGTRDQAYTHQPVVITDETVTIDTYQVAPQYVDRADLALCSYASQMSLASEQGVLLNEAIETAMLGQHAQWTNFDNESIGGSAGNITVSDTNIVKIVNGLKREIREAKGENLFNRNGGFIVWRPADFELIESYAAATGFMTADQVLRNGTNQGFQYLGFRHYSSNAIASGHLFGGVRGVFHAGIVRGTYGQVITVDEPATAEGAVSAVGVISRVDYKFKAWNKTKPVLFDINVA